MYAEDAPFGVRVPCKAQTLGAISDRILYPTSGNLLISGLYLRDKTFAAMARLAATLAPAISTAWQRRAKELQGTRRASASPPPLIPPRHHPRPTLCYHKIAHMWLMRSSRHYLSSPSSAFNRIVVSAEVGQACCTVADTPICPTALHSCAVWTPEFIIA